LKIISVRVTYVDFDNRFDLDGDYLGWDDFHYANVTSFIDAGRFTVVGGGYALKYTSLITDVIPYYNGNWNTNYVFSADIEYMSPGGQLDLGADGLPLQTFYSSGPQTFSFSYSPYFGAGIDLTFNADSIVLDNIKLIHDVPPYLYNRADIRQSTDYSPFGVTLENRNLTLTGAEKSRYGYQGSEMDDEVKDNGNSYTTEFRQLDPRLGRWLSIDPKASPWESPYVSMGNNPIMYNDILGDTIRKTKEFRKQYSQAYKKFAKSDAGKEFIKNYDIGGKYEHISVVFGLEDHGQAGQGGHTEAWAIPKAGGDPIALDFGNIEGASPKHLVSNQIDHYVEFRILMHPGYGVPGEKINELQIVKAGADILHETQHARIGTDALYAGKNVPSPYSQHSTLDRGIYYQERVNYWWQFTPVWYQDYSRLKKMTDKGDKHNKQYPKDHWYSPGIHNGIEYINMKDQFMYGDKRPGE